MVRVLWVLVVLVALWCGWWALAAFGFSSSIQAWFEERRAEGWQAEVSEIATAGFPTQVTARLRDVNLADTTNGVVVGLDQLDLSFRAIWPGDMWVTAPQTPIRLATPQGQWLIETVNGQADLNLHPGSTLELENMSFASDALEVSDTQGEALMQSGATQAALVQTEIPTVYDVSFDAQNFVPGRHIRELLQLDAGLPQAFETLIAVAQVTLDDPIDRATLEDQRPQPSAIVIERLDAKWGDMRLLAIGDMIRDADGYADGQITIKAENWQRMLDLAVAGGLLPEQFRPQAEGLIASVAAGTGQTNSLDVTLTFADGLTRFGFIPIGRAPRMAIR